MQPSEGGPRVLVLEQQLGKDCSQDMRIPLGGKKKLGDNDLVWENTALNMGTERGDSA